MNNIDVRMHNKSHIVLESKAKPVVQRLSVRWLICPEMLFRGEGGRVLQ